MDTATELSNIHNIMDLSTRGRYELIKGVIYELAPAGERQGVTSSRIIQKIGRFVEENKSGITTSSETGYLISSNPDTVRAPDMAFKSNKRLKESGISDGYSSIMPELVVEVISPNDRHSQIIQKVNDWLTAGVKYVWIVDPYDYSVTVYKEFIGNVNVLSKNDELIAEDILPGFKCNVNELFYFYE